jgi:hypothetical protein
MHRELRVGPLRLTFLDGKGRREATRDVLNRRDGGESEVRNSRLGRFVGATGAAIMNRAPWPMLRDIVLCR